MNISAFASLNSTRLVRLLSDQNVSGIKVSRAHFAERFAQMLHFSSVINLSMALEDVSGVDFKPSGISGLSIRNAFLSAQTELVRFIITGFAPITRRMDNPLPTAESLHTHCELTGIFSAKHKGKSKKQTTAYEPYRKFYMSRQRGLDIRVQHLRAEIRDSISGLSPVLAQLSRMDKALSESISEASREIFALVPKLLEQRFTRLFDIHRPELPENPEVTDLEPWMKPGGWISAFCIEMRELLLAELEVRLQPVVGMIDSLPPTTIQK
ncbi:MAG: DUF3348 family protein [Desulfosalsimonadaceae bacterium]|nr:DUF3348 family protein [Desulfosalsimonadaceae bacterium]